MQQFYRLWKHTVVCRVFSSKRLYCGEQSYYSSEKSLHVENRPNTSITWTRRRCTSSQVKPQFSNDKKCITFCRKMVPDDANVLGIVHGSAILQLCDEAASILAARYVNCSVNKIQNQEQNVDQSGAVPTLARISSLEFSKQVYVGEVVDLKANVKYTSKHSLLVQLEVHAEDTLTANTKLCSVMELWYVPVALKEGFRLKDVPPLDYEDPDEKCTGDAKYLALRNERSVVLLHPSFEKPENCDQPYTVGYAATLLAKLVMPSDINSNGDCQGGVILSLMDQCAGIVAAKHCGRVTVTKAIDAINFYQRVRKGAVLTVSGRPTFTSDHTIEVQLVVDAEYPFEGTWTRYRVVEAYFVEVPLDSAGQLAFVPKLQIFSKEEEMQFHAGKQRFDYREKMKENEKSDSSKHPGIINIQKPPPPPPEKLI